MKKYKTDYGFGEIVAECNDVMCKVVESKDPVMTIGELFPVRDIRIAEWILIESNDETVKF